MAGPRDFTRSADKLDLHDSLDDGDGDLVRVRARHVRVGPMRQCSTQKRVHEQHGAVFLQCGSGSFGICLALENDRQALLVLRHHRRLPSATYAFVEKIGQRILILARVSRESVDDRLVFFHAREDSSFPPMTTTPEFANLTLVRHPLVQHKITLLRDRRTPTKIFKELVDEIAMLMAYEATAELSLDPVTVQTPLEQATGYQVSGKKLTLVPILRAGLGMVEGYFGSSHRHGWATSGCIATTTRSNRSTITSRFPATRPSATSLCWTQCWRLAVVLFPQSAH